MTVSLAQARAFVLARQGLSGDGLDTVMDAVEATAGIYSTAPTCYLSCAARVRDFRLAQLDEELYVKRSLVRLRCMRGGMAYIEPVDLLPVLHACTGEDPTKTIRRIAKWSGLGEERLLALADRIEALVEKPMTAAEIRVALGDAAPSGQAVTFTVGLLGRQARLVRAEVRGSWRSDVYTYARWAEWLGAPVAQIDPAVARVELARRYLRAFGPATVADLKWWTGWTKRDTVAAVAALGDAATETDVGLVLTEDAAALHDTDPDSARGVRLLPVWDAYLMAYAAAPSGRARLIAEGDYGRAYDRSGNGTSVVLVDGVVGGVWELDDETVTVAPFRNIDWDEVEAATRRLAASIGAAGLRVERAPAPRPLTDAARNAFLSPIRLGAG